MRAHPLPEARDYADLMLTELRKVIPSWCAASTSRQGHRLVEYMEKTAPLWPTGFDVFGDEGPTKAQPATLALQQAMSLSDAGRLGPDAEVKVVTAMLYPYTHLSEELSSACRG